MISGNKSHGVYINNSNNTHSNRIQGNFIGTAAGGTNAIPNLGNGVYLSECTGALIGGAAPNQRNIISGNAGSGVTVDMKFNADTAYIVGNFIGLDVTGTKSLPNGLYGLEAVAYGTEEAPYTPLIVGGLSSSEGNLISGNTRGGISIYRGCCSGLPIVVAGNVIGMDFSRSLGRGNGGPGIIISGGSHISIRSNSIAFNSGLGIDLGTPGVTANDIGDADSGANSLQNFPAITLATNTGSALLLTGTLQSESNALYALDFFVSDFRDPSGNGEGQVFLGSSTILTDASGEASFNVSFPSVHGRFATATATSLAGDTSEFSLSSWIYGLPEDFGLSMRPSPQKVVQWSSAAFGYSLQWTPSLGPPVQWTTISSNAIQDDGFIRSWSPGQDVSKPIRFFRLAKP